MHVATWVPALPQDTFGVRAVGVKREEGSRQAVRNSGVLDGFDLSTKVIRRGGAGGAQGVVRTIGFTHPIALPMPRHRGAAMAEMNTDLRLASRFGVAVTYKNDEPSAHYRSNTPGVTASAVARPFLLHLDACPNQNHLGRPVWLR